MLSLDNYIFVRGMPIEKEEVWLQQQRLGAQLFDESMFDAVAKKTACANVLLELDRKFAESIALKGPLGKEEIRTIDIGDKNWLYIPIMLLPPTGESGIVMATSDSPAGKVGWFRMKRFTRGGIH